MKGVLITKKLLSIILSLSLLFAMGIQVFAANVEEENGSSIVDVDPNSPAPCYMTESFSAVFDGNTSILKQITFTNEYKYFTMTVKNTGDYAISVDLGNKVYTVNPHSSKIIYSTSAWGAQTCTFGFATKTTGQPMYGSVECMLATTLAEVTP